MVIFSNDVMYLYYNLFLKYFKHLFDILFKKFLECVIIDMKGDILQKKG